MKTNKNQSMFEMGNEHTVEAKGETRCKPVSVLLLAVSQWNKAQFCLLPCHSPMSFQAEASCHQNDTFLDLHLQVGLKSYSRKPINTRVPQAVSQAGTCSYFAKH